MRPIRTIYVFQADEGWDAWTKAGDVLIEAVRADKWEAIGLVAERLLADGFSLARTVSIRNRRKD